ncbi:MAG: hypothetical protein KA141_04335 [Rubrivivax sp.]|jgi:hypothetical protein|nr:hypothetical protein [Rubrivivax sp.]
MKADLLPGGAPERRHSGPPRAQTVSSLLKALAGHGRRVLPGLRQNSQPAATDAGDETAMQAHCL